MKQLLINLLIRYGFMEADYTVEIAIAMFTIKRWVLTCENVPQLEMCEDFLEKVMALYRIDSTNFYVKLLVDAFQEKRIAIQLYNEESLKI